MKTILFFIVIIPSFAIAQSTETYFDFWVGNWDLTWQHTDGSEGTGTNLIEKTLDGVVIQENFRALTGAYAGLKGTSLSVYNPQTKTWKQAWADNQGSYFDFTGVVENGQRIFQTEEQTLADGRTLIQRMRFYDIEQDTFKWDWESSFDGGVTWTLNWRIFYRRSE
ncbi:MAG: hypothetical protein NXI08_13840 [bacterium]|nr:hypothetical protein [bacterium]